MENATIADLLDTMTEETTLSPFVAFIELVTEMLYKWWTIFAFVFGIPGNMMSLMITLKKDNRQISTCIYMAGLAIVDTGVLIFSEILWKLIVAHRLVPGMEGSFALLSSLWYGAESMAVSSGLFLAEMSIDRTIAILYPMKAVTICTASRAVKITVSTCLIEVGLHLQTFFVLDVPDPPNGALIRNFPEARWFETFYNTYLLILGTILPFSTIAICNITILVAINRASVRRRKMKSDTAEKGKIRDSNLTAMLLMTSFAYLLCSCPKRIYESSVEYDLSIPYWKARYWLQYFVCTELWTVNFGINFYLYFLGGGSKFRRDAKEVLMRCCPRAKK